MWIATDERQRVIWKGESPEGAPEGSQTVELTYISDLRLEDRFGWIWRWNGQGLELLPDEEKDKKKDREIPEAPPEEKTPDITQVMRDMAELREEIDMILSGDIE